MSINSAGASRRRRLDAYSLPSEKCTMQKSNLQPSDSPSVVFGVNNSRQTQTFVADARARIGRARFGSVFGGLQSFTD